jgi:hypothetical protein
VTLESVLKLCCACAAAEAANVGARERGEILWCGVVEDGLELDIRSRNCATGAEA